MSDKVEVIVDPKKESKVKNILGKGKDFVKSHKKAFIAGAIALTAAGLVLVFGDELDILPSGDGEAPFEADA